MGLITFISSNSLWMYLWHIFVIKIQRTILTEINWVLQWVLIVCVSIAITYVQMLVIKRLEGVLPPRYSKFLKIFKG